VAPGEGTSTSTPSAKTGRGRAASFAEFGHLLERRADSESGGEMAAGRRSGRRHRAPSHGFFLEWYEPPSPTPSGTRELARGATRLELVGLRRKKLATQMDSRHHDQAGSALDGRPNLVLFSGPRAPDRNPGGDLRKACSPGRFARLGRGQPRIKPSCGDRRARHCTRRERAPAWCGAVARPVTEEQK